MRIGLLSVVKVMLKVTSGFALGLYVTPCSAAEIPSVNPSKDSVKLLLVQGNALESNVTHSVLRMPAWLDILEGVIPRVELAQVSPDPNEDRFLQPAPDPLPEETPDTQEEILPESPTLIQPTESESSETRVLIRQVVTVPEA